MIAELLTLAALAWADPSGDAHGAGDLTPPTASVYSSLAPFDLVEVRIPDETELVVEVRLAGIPNPGRLPNGLTLPVIDVYLDTGEGGREELLDGPEMRMPAGRGWELALRVHGDDAFLVVADDADGPSRPLSVQRRGDVLRLGTGLARPETVRDVQAVVGVYDPFSRDGWRPLAAAPSPWAFASATPAPPVIDLLAADDASQRDALRAFTLPSRRGRGGATLWLVLMLAGLAVAIAGLALRRRVPSPAPVMAGAAGDGAEGRAPADATAPASAAAADAGPVGAATPSGSASVPTPRIGRAGRAGARPAADRRRTSTGDAATDEATGRALRTSWAGEDGWWIEDPDASGQVGAPLEPVAPRETLWDEERRSEDSGDRAEDAPSSGEAPRQAVDAVEPERPEGPEPELAEPERTEPELVVPDATEGEPAEGDTADVEHREDEAEDDADDDADDDGSRLR